MTAAPPTEPPNWTPAEIAAWRPRERLTPSQWAERHRRLSRKQSGYAAGPWRNANAPYLAGIMDLAAAPHVRELVIMKAAQVGASEALRNVIGYLLEREADPILCVLPNETDGRRIMNTRVKPLIQDTPILRELQTAAARDVQTAFIQLSNGGSIRLGWSGSAASLASDPMRVVILDEVDKYSDWAGEASPIELARLRTQTYRHSKVIANSTPTTRVGYVANLYDDCEIKLFYHVPCPHCARFIRLVFAQVRWEKTTEDRRRNAADIASGKAAAWYECQHCRGRTDDRQKAAAVRAGVWATEAVAAGADFADRAARAGTNAVVIDDWLSGTRVAMHVSALYPLWITWAAGAAAFLRAQENPDSLAAFVNGWLGEPFEQRVARPEAEVFTAKARRGGPRGIVPAWAQALLCTVDVQLDRLICVVRAGRGRR
ncbi:Phage terminase large subunit (GpA) [Phycisphaerae bacterium RAS1]|nr:Phage terminase large subunit (GpA) [Phycisphaerae bacterium RAS1]